MDNEPATATYRSKRNPIPEIHRKVDRLGPSESAVVKPIEVNAETSAPRSGAKIPFFSLVRTPVAKAAPAPKKTPAPVKKAPAKRKTLPTDYKGDVHEVVDLEGIGPAYEKKLHAAKIFNTQELLFTGNKRLANITGAPAKTIQNWKDMCQLVKVKGIGPQFAELMVRAGIGGIEDLKTLDPVAAVKRIKDYEAGLKSKVTGSGIGLKRMRAWQKLAKPMRKVGIDLKKIEVIALESRAAIAAKKN